MTSSLDDDAFEMRFEDAVQDMHTRTAGGVEPNQALWKTIRSQMNPSARAETADPRATGPDLTVAFATTERNKTMDKVLATPTGGFTSQQSHLSRWMVLLAAGLVGIMIISSVMLNGGQPPPHEHSNLAWAPGMGTPESSPVADFACTVVPLTVDEVMDTVMNPSRGYVRLGHPENPQSTGDVFESNYYDVNKIPDKSGYAQNGDPEALADASAAANMYSSCIQTGTMFQIWAIVDPVIVQLDILARFPVVRSEEGIREFVETWGPRAYPGGGNGVIGHFIGRAKPASNADWLGSSMIDGRKNDLAIISIFEENPTEGQSPTRIEVALQLFPNGQWIITNISPIGLRG